jgi:hypothetical protein
LSALFVDPGESTGWALTADSVIVAAGTHSLDEFVDAVGAALLGDRENATRVDPELVAELDGVEQVVIEDWVIYEWEAQNLAWDKCRTARGIGALEFICRTADVPYTLQPAKIKETARAAGVEDLYYRPLDENRHQNDALQHAVYWHLKQGLPAVRHQEGAALA